MTLGSCADLPAADWPPSKVDVDGHLCRKGVVYIGTATLDATLGPITKSGPYRALANVDGALCIVQANIHRVACDAPTFTECTWRTKEGSS